MKNQFYYFNIVLGNMRELTIMEYPITIYTDTFFHAWDKALSSAKEILSREHDRFWTIEKIEHDYWKDN